MLQLSWGTPGLSHCVPSDLSPLPVFPLPELQKLQPVSSGMKGLNRASLPFSCFGAVALGLVSWPPSLLFLDMPPLALLAHFLWLKNEPLARPTVSLTFGHAVFLPSLQFCHKPHSLSHILGKAL